VKNSQIYHKKNNTITGIAGHQIRVRGPVQYKVQVVLKKDRIIFLKTTQNFQENHPHILNYQQTKMK
jgi:hypothetical protein